MPDEEEEGFEIETEKRGAYRDWAVERRDLELDEGEREPDREDREGD